MTLKQFLVDVIMQLPKPKYQRKKLETCKPQVLEHTLISPKKKSWVITSLLFLDFHKFNKFVRLFNMHTAYRVQELHVCCIHKVHEVLKWFWQWGIEIRIFLGIEKGVVGELKVSRSGNSSLCRILTWSKVHFVIQFQSSVRRKNFRLKLSSNWALKLYDKVNLPPTERAFLELSWLMKQGKSCITAPLISSKIYSHHNFNLKKSTMHDIPEVWQILRWW